MTDGKKERPFFGLHQKERNQSINRKTSIRRSLTVNLMVILLYILIRGGRTLRPTLPIVGDCLYHVQYTVIIEKEKGREEKVPRPLEYPGLAAGWKFYPGLQKYPGHVRLPMDNTYISTRPGM